MPAWIKSNRIYKQPCSNTDCTSLIKIKLLKSLVRDASVTFLCTSTFISRLPLNRTSTGILISPPEPPSLHNGRSRCSYQHHTRGRWRYSHEAFARQMMSSYWFGDVEDYKRFSGDTLREYKRYFSDYDYTQWDNDEFLEQKQLFGMTKWSNSLCQKFQKLCQEMEQAIVGWKYL